MATGLIQQFPIDTIFEFATENRHGLCNNLESTIRTSNLASRDTTGSEQAIREAIDEVNTAVSYESYGTLPAIEVAEEFITDTVMFRSIKADTGIVINSTSTEVDLAANGLHLTGPDLDLLGTMSVQGGTLQLSRTLNMSDFITDTFYTKKCLFAIFPANTCIGKTFIKCVTPFDNTGCSFSFGIEGERDRWIAQSRVPSAAGFYEHWSYGLGLVEERDVLDVTTSGYIYIYSSVADGIVNTLPSVGTIGISVFYDSIVWPS